MPSVSRRESVMQLNKQSRFKFRLDNALFYVLFLGLIGIIAWATQHYSFEADWTASQRNSLSQTSISLLQNLEGPIEITAFVREGGALPDRIKDLVARYQRIKPEIQLKIVNPDKHPEQVRDLGITMDGELIIRYQGRTENIRELSEEVITNKLQRLVRQDQRFIVFVTGHGERDPFGQANHDYEQWTRFLLDKGLKVETVNIATTGTVPDNTAVLVIAGPAVRLFPNEVTVLQRYLEEGGNLLWLMDPDEALHGLEPLADYLGLQRLPGRVVSVSPIARLLGIDDPTIVLVDQYPYHPITREFATMTLLPEAVAMLTEPVNDWEAKALLSTSDVSWTETGELAGQIQHDPEQGEVAGPLDVAWVLTRPINTDAAEDSEEAAPRQQRVAVIGDGDFLSNAFLGNGANLDLSVSLANWLVGDDALISIPARTAVDASLELSDGLFIAYAVFFVIGLP
ncbi:MAG TPA: ABC transporter [Gammaproteobacteria bacterium]|nr:ABC transporter [Gammaproteobacteria bacterium]